MFSLPSEGTIKKLLTAALAAVTMTALMALPAPAGAQQNQTFFAPVRNMPEGRGFHGSAVLGDYLYVFSGQTRAGETRETEKPDPSVWKARIYGRNQLGEWDRTTSLPATRYYIANSTLVLNDVVYIIGGSEQVLEGRSHDTAIWSKPLPNGTLTPWQTSSSFPGGASCPAAVSTPGHIHVIGGLMTNDQVSNHVWTNPVHTDGSLSKWQPGPPMPIPLWFHQAGVVAGRIYVWGGLVEDVDPGDPVRPSPYVLSAPILSTGKLGAWRREQQLLPAPFYSAATTVAGPFLMSFSPRYQGAQISNDVWFTRIGPQGMEPWRRKTTDIPNKVYHAVAPDYRRGVVFLSGGRGPEFEYPLLEVGAVFGLTSEAARQAEQTWLAAQTAHSNSVSSLAASLEESAKGSGGASGGRYLSYIADRTLQEGAVDGFLTITDARRIAERDGKPLVMYFNVQDAVPCQEQKRHLETEKFAQLTQHAAFAWIDTREYPQLCQQIGVYRVPTWVFFDARGEKRGMRIGVMTPEELVAGLLQVIRQQ